MNSKKILLIAAVPVFLALAISCSKSSDSSSESGAKVKVSARSLLSLNGTANLRAQNDLAQAAGLFLGGPESPDTANGEYNGMGVLTSEAVVESFKIQISKISFGTKAPRTTGGTTKEFVFDKEVEIADGLNSAVEVTGTLPEGTYVVASVGFKPTYKLKGYAYFDTDNDGTIDTTVYTTAAEVKKVTGRIAKAAMTDYAEYKYGFMFTHCSSSVTDSVTDSAGECGTFSVFPEPIVVTASPDEADKDTSTGAMVVNVLIDSTNIVTAWTGATGNYTFKTNDATNTILGDSTKVPDPVGFPLSSVCSDTKNSAGLNSCDFFPVGKPSFKLAYIPAFAFLGTSKLTSQVYLVSKEQSNYNHYNSGTLQLVFSDGKPLLGLINSKLLGQYDSTVTPSKYIGGQTPILGSVARLFEASGSTYTFYMDSGAKDANGVEDGGLYYNNDKTMAGYIAEGFTPATAVGTEGTIVVKDGPRCKSEYDYCIGSRTYYTKRIK